MAFSSRRLLFRPDKLRKNVTFLPCFDCWPDCPPPCPPYPYSTPVRPPLSSFLPPPPPPPPPLVSEQVQHISPLVIAIVVILGSLFLMISYYAILMKYCSNWRNPRRRSPQQEDTHEDFIDENHGPVLDHPIWYIATVGLEQSIINAISVYKYKKGEGLVEGTDCSVCLSEFDEDETLRLLPKCSHAFHLPCIDTWLRSHTNCPLCRAPIVTTAVRSTSTAIVPNSNNSEVGEETRVENSEINGGLVPDRSSGVGLISDSRMGIDEESDLPEGRRDMNLIKERESSPIPDSEIRVLSDLADNHRSVENEIQPVRRSVSMDFSMVSMFCFSVANSLPVEEEGSSAVQPVDDKNSNLAIVPKIKSSSPSIFGLMGSSSKGRFLQKGPVSMKRSFSSGGKLFLSRYSQNQNSILPM